ncbi:MAG: DUF1566 domain-containing protein [Nitrospinales bacterium]
MEQKAVSDFEEYFKDNGDGTIVDLEADLLWCKKDSRQELGKWLNWNEANAYMKACNEQNYLGYNDWRLPTKSELRGLFGMKEAFRQIFLNLPAQAERKVSNYRQGGELSYWTGETRHGSFAWKSYFPNPREICVDQQVSTTGTSVRLVRDL